MQVASLIEEVRGQVQGPAPAKSWKPWFPVIDYGRCTNCMQCLSFCLFDVYGVSADKKIQVQNQSNCKTDCPACSRVCPEVAIMFPKYRHGPINGEDVQADDVRRDADGTWRIKAGAQVRVRLTMVTPSRRYHVALVDQIPAVLEAMNPELAVTGSIPQDPKESTNRWWWWRVWYEHQNMRDERVEAFASLLWDGVYTYSYVARATTPGTFVVPPAKAEEMYHPETFGRSATARVIVE